MSSGAKSGKLGRAVAVRNSFWNGFLANLLENNFRFSGSTHAIPVKVWALAGKESGNSAHLRENSRIFSSETAATFFRRWANGVVRELGRTDLTGF